MAARGSSPAACERAASRITIESVEIRKAAIEETLRVAIVGVDRVVQNAGIVRVLNGRYRGTEQRCHQEWRSHCEVHHDTRSLPSRLLAVKP